MSTAPAPVRDASDRRGYERYVPSRWADARRRDGNARSSDDVPTIARGWRSLAPAARGRGEPLELESVSCNLCGPSLVEPVGVGEDFEYWTSPDSFLAVRCRQCGLVFLDPRPARSELGRIYPDEYHAFEFTPERFRLVYRARAWLEARRVRAMTEGLPADARVVDVGCGDGFFLDLLRHHGPSTWTVEGVEPDLSAADAARARGLSIHPTVLSEAPIEPGSVDLVILIQTIEHVADPVQLLSEIATILKPNGRLVVVTDNVDSPDFHLFKSRHWGGWHFPRQWHLYDATTLAATAERAGLRVEDITTMVSPVNWVHSVRNLLVDVGAPETVVKHLALDAPVGLAIGTAFDAMWTALGKGALLRGRFRRPAAPTGVGEAR